MLKRKKSRTSLKPLNQELTTLPEEQLGKVVGGLDDDGGLGTWTDPQHRDDIFRIDDE